MDFIIVCLVVLAIVAFAFWMKYEITHPMDADDVHDEAIKFRESRESRND